MKWRKGMKISTKGRYGIRLMLCLALQYKQARYIPLKIFRTNYQSSYESRFCKKF